MIAALSQMAYIDEHSKGTQTSASASASHSAPWQEDPIGNEFSKDSGDSRHADCYGAAHSN